MIAVTLQFDFPGCPLTAPGKMPIVEQPPGSRSRSATTRVCHVTWRHTGLRNTPSALSGWSPPFQLQLTLRKNGVTRCDNAKTRGTEVEIRHAVKVTLRDEALLATTSSLLNGDGSSRSLILVLRGAPTFAYPDECPDGIEGLCSTIKKSPPMELLTPKQAAAILAVEVETLTKWRWSKTGPSYHRIGGPTKGAIRYAQSDLEDFLSSSRVEV